MVERLGRWVTVPTGLRCRLLTSSVLTSQHLLPPSGPCSSYLPATPGRPKQSSAVPYSAFPSERAARLALLAHRPRGFSPPSLSLFLPLPPPSVRPSLTQPSTTICLSTTINTQPQPQTPLTSPPAFSFPPFRREHHFIPWCSHNLQPGSKPCNSPYCRPRPSISPAPAQPSPAQFEMDPPNKRRRLAPKVPEPAPIPTASATAAAAATVPTPATTPQQAQYSPEQVSPWINLFASTPSTRPLPD